MVEFVTLRGKRALVTAGTKGAGAAVVDLFRDLGAQILTTARTRADTVSEEEFIEPTSPRMKAAQQSRRLPVSASDPSISSFTCWAALQRRAVGLQR